MPNDIYLHKKKRLEAELLRAVLDLYAHTNTKAFAFEIPKTTPPVYILSGDKEEVKKLLEQA